MTTRQIMFYINLEREEKADQEFDDQKALTKWV